MIFIASVAVGSLPVAVAVNSVSDMIYVVNGNDNSVSVVDGHTNTVTTVIQVGHAPVGVAVTLPGVSTVASRDDSTNGVGFAVNGLRPRANNFLIDGFDNNDNGDSSRAGFFDSASNDDDGDHDSDGFDDDGGDDD